MSVYSVDPFKWMFYRFSKDSHLPSSDKQYEPNT